MLYHILINHLIFLINYQLVEGPMSFISHLSVPFCDGWGLLHRLPQPNLLCHIPTQEAQGGRRSSSCVHVICMATGHMTTGHMTTGHMTTGHMTTGHMAKGLI